MSEASSSDQEKPPTTYMLIMRGEESEPAGMPILMCPVCRASTKRMCAGMWTQRRSEIRVESLAGIAAETTNRLTWGKRFTCWPSCCAWHGSL
jgi:hypothetical protein